MGYESSHGRVVPVHNLCDYFRTSIDDVIAQQGVEIDPHATHYVVNMMTLFSRSEELYEDDGDTYGLKCAGCRVLVFFSTGNGFGDQLHQFPGCPNFAYQQRSFDRLGNATGESFFTIYPKHANKLLFFDLPDPGCSIHAAFLVHAHIKGAIAGKTETTFGRVELG